MTTETIVWDGLSAEEIDATLLDIRRRHACLTWELSKGLFTLKNSGAYAELGFKSPVRYAYAVLGVHPVKYRELVRAYGVLLRTPILARAFAWVN